MPKDLTRGPVFHYYLYSYLKHDWQNTETGLWQRKGNVWQIEGKIDQADYEPVVSVENKMDNNDKLNVYVEIPRMPGITLPAIWEGIKSGLAKLRKYNKKLNKAAVVTD